MFFITFIMTEILLVGAGLDQNAVFWYLYFFMFILCLKTLPLLLDLCLYGDIFSTSAIDTGLPWKLLPLVVEQKWVWVLQKTGLSAILYNYNKIDRWLKLLRCVDFNPNKHQTTSLIKNYQKQFNTHPPSFDIVCQCIVYRHQQQKLLVMNLNPLSTNYIHNLPFHKLQIRGTHTPNCKTSTAAKNSNFMGQQRIEKYDHSCQKYHNNGFKTCSFTLQQPRTTSHLIYTKQGYMFGLTRRQGRIDKRSIILFPDGTFANCYVQGGRLNGWAVLCKKNSFYNIFQYKGSKLQGDQYIYDIKCGIMLRSNYLNGRLNSIHKCCAQNQTKFQKFVNNKLVYNLLKQTLDCVFLKNYYPSIECTMGTYFGSKRGSIPYGVGVLVTDLQIFYGQFQEGLLNGYGTISYQDGNYYIGELQGGLTRGIGQYTTNGKTAYKYNQTTANETIYNHYFEIKSWKEDKQISNIYAPIITFYLKLRKIELERMREPENNQSSLVDVEMVNEEDEQEVAERKDSSSPAQTDRLDYSKRNQQKEEYGGDSGRIQPDDFIRTNIQPEQKEQHIKIEILEDNTAKQEEQTQKPKKNTGKLNKKKNKYAMPNSRQTNPILNDNQWQQIIEELEGEESVGREDAFLQPDKQSVKSGEQAEMHAKGNPLNSRQMRVDLNKIKGEEQQQLMQKEEEKKLNRIMQKTAKKP